LHMAGRFNYIETFTDYLKTHMLYKER
jgi:hypothetical protein